MVLEIGYVGSWSRHLFQGKDINDVPYMMKLNGQTFAQAYAGLYNQLNAGQKNLSPQPWFEAALGGTSFCKGAASCTAAVAAGESSNILTQDVTSLWSDLDGSFKFGTGLPSTNQCFWCYGNTADGYSNYQALVVSLQKRFSHGLTLNSNFTYAHALGTIGIPQSFTLNNVNDPWDLRKDYGPQFFDRKFVFNLFGTYTLPFGKCRRWANTHPVATRAFGGWSISPVFTLGSGLPLGVFTGSGDERGNGFDGNGCTAVPISSRGYSNSPNFNIKSDGNVGVNGDSSQGGSGVNIYSNPTAVFNSFRPYILGIEGNCAGAGILRAQVRWNLDLGITKDTQITERVGLTIYAQMFNALNHMQWSDPCGAGGSPGLSLQDPNHFCVLSCHFNPLTLL